MSLGIVLLIASLVLSIFLLTSVNNIMGIRYIGNAFGSHMVISDAGYATIWFVTIALFGAGVWNLLDGIKGKDNNKIKLFDQKKCPRCAETIKFEARVCKYCGHEYDDQEIEKEIEDRRKLLQQDEYALDQIEDYRLLQIAYDYQYNQHDFGKAKYYLERLRREFPQSEYLPYVEQRLREMGVGEGKRGPSQNFGMGNADRVPLAWISKGQDWQFPNIKIAAPAYPFLLGCGVLIVLGLIFSWWLVILGLVAGAFLAYCFRDPDRPIPSDPRAVVAPADGKVLFVDTVWEDRFLKTSAQRVAILLSLLDVHVNRSPIAGMVVKTEHQPGQFAAPARREADKTNEQRIWMLVDEDDKRFLLVQMAGQLTRRIIPFAQGGQRLDRGERLGMICFGSRVDLFLPLEAQVTVAPGTNVLAGTDVVARLPMT